VTLIAVLNGLTMASMEMVRVGDSEKVAWMLMGIMRDMMDGYTPEQRVLLATELTLLSGLANRFEPLS